MLYIHHATVLTSASRLEESAVLIEGQRIVKVGPAAEIPCPPGSQSLDATGLLLALGFIDLQLNGAFGHDFTAQPETIWMVAAGLPHYGVTTFLLTLITSLLETMAAVQAVLAQGAP